MSDCNLLSILLIISPSVRLKCFLLQFLAAAVDPSEFLTTLVWDLVFQVGKTHRQADQPLLAVAPHHHIHAENKALRLPFYTTPKAIRHDTPILERSKLCKCEGEWRPILFQL